MTAIAFQNIQGVSAGSVIVPRLPEAFREFDDGRDQLIFLIVVQEALLETLWHSGRLHRLPSDIGD